MRAVNPYSDDGAYHDIKHDVRLGLPFLPMHSTFWFLASGDVLRPYRVARLAGEVMRNW